MVPEITESGTELHYRTIRLRENRYYYSAQSLCGGYVISVPRANGEQINAGKTRRLSLCPVSRYGNPRDYYACVSEPNNNNTPAQRPTHFTRAFINFYNLNTLHDPMISFL